MLIKKYNDYIYEENDVNVKELPMFYSPKFTNIIKSIDSIISRELLALTRSDKLFTFSYADTTDNIDFISVLSVNRIERIDGVGKDDLENPDGDSVLWGKKLSQKIRVGTFVNKLLPKYNGSKELEDFVHNFKSKLDVENYEIRLIKGEEIRKWYHIKTYYNKHPGIVNKPAKGDDPRSPLMKSCLKLPEKQPFFDIYTENPEQVGMLIMLNGDGKLVARAIIWFDCFIVNKAENSSKGVLMDRIYYTQESDVNIFIDYAKEHGWWYKPSQSKEISSFVKDDVVCDIPISTKLTRRRNFDKYPYMDTLCFYTPTTGRLSSRPTLNPVTKEIMDRYQLRRTNGMVRKL